MAKGKPNGFKVESKRIVGAKSMSRSRAGQAGAGSQATGTEMGISIGRFDPSILQAKTASLPTDKRVNAVPYTGNPAGNITDGNKQRVHFELQDEHAEKVCIAGTFNDWHPGASEMISLGNGRWCKDLLLAPGEYEYRFVVDGVWVIDPASSEQKPNGFGDHNSVVVVSP